MEHKIQNRIYNEKIRSHAENLASFSLISLIHIVSYLNVVIKYPMVISIAFYNVFQSNKTGHNFMAVISVFHVTRR